MVVDVEAGIIFFLAAALSLAAASSSRNDGFCRLALPLGLPLGALRGLHVGEVAVAFRKRGGGRGKKRVKVFFVELPLGSLCSSFFPLSLSFSEIDRQAHTHHRANSTTSAGWCLRASLASPSRASWSPRGIGMPLAVAVAVAAVAVAAVAVAAVAVVAGARGGAAGAEGAAASTAVASSGSAAVQRAASGAAFSRKTGEEAQGSILRSRETERKKEKKKKRCEGKKGEEQEFFHFFFSKIFFFYTSATHSSARSSLAAAYRIAYVSPSRSSTVLEPSGSTSTVPVFFFGFGKRWGEKVSFPLSALARRAAQGEEAHEKLKNEKRERENISHPCPPGPARRRARPGWAR